MLPINHRLYFQDDIFDCKRSFYESDKDFLGNQHICLRLYSQQLAHNFNKLNNFYQELYEHYHNIVRVRSADDF